MIGVHRLASAHSWLLSEQHTHFELGHLLNSAVTDALEPQLFEIGPYHAGMWECDLIDQSLVWSGGVYDLFGLQRDTPVNREQALAHYSDDSHQKLERLRSFAIRHGHGFTLDAEIREAAVGRSRRIRLIAAPVMDRGIATHLHGVKLAL